jgi:hypothetical protein
LEFHNPYFDREMLSRLDQLLGLYSPALNNAATFRLGLMLADKPGRLATVLALASQEAALACSAVGAS